MLTLYFTQIDPPAESICSRLAQKGWRCAHLAFRRVAFHTAHLDPGCYDALLITSKQAVRWLLAQNFPALPPLAVVGSASSALLAAGQLLFPDRAPADAAELAQYLKCHFNRPSRFLFLRGSTAKDTLATELTDHYLQQQVVYSTEKLSKKFPPLKAASMVYFQAPSTVSDYFEHFGVRPGSIAVIGPSTALAVKKLGWPIDFQPARPENRLFVEELPSAAQFKRKDEA